MSVYIKGMEMPVDCLSCRVACDKENYGVIGRPPKCPLAEAPVGDLIGRAETIEAVELMEIFLGERKKNAVIRGIQTLPSAKPTGDLISRADAIDAVQKIVPVETEIDSTLLDKAEVIVELSALPSAEAVQGWIPIEESEPNTTDNVLVTYKWYDDDYETSELDYWINKYEAENGNEMCQFFHNRIIAWQLKPKPYKGGDDE